MIRMENTVLQGGEAFQHNSQYLTEMLKDRAHQQQHQTKSKTKARAVSLANTGMSDLNNAREDFMLKSLSKQAKENRSGDDSSYVASHEENRHVEEQDTRAMSARRRRVEVNVALDKGHELSMSERLILIGSSRNHLDQEGSSSINNVQDLLDTQPFLSNDFSTINRLQQGMIQTAYLGGLVEGNKYTYRVPSALQHRKRRAVGSRGYRSRLSSTLSPVRPTAINNSSLSISSRIRHIQTAEEKNAMYYGAVHQMRERGKIRQQYVVGGIRQRKR